MNLGAFLGTVLTVTFANPPEARTRRPAVIITLAAIVFLVSGSIGFRGPASPSEGNTDLARVQLP